MSDQLMENLRIDNDLGDDETRLKTFSREVTGAMLDVIEAVEFRRTQDEPCDRCYDDGCGAAFCPCDYGCHDSVEAADTAIYATLSRFREVAS